MKTVNCSCVEKGGLCPRVYLYEGGDLLSMNLNLFMTLDENWMEAGCVFKIFKNVNLAR